MKMTGKMLFGCSVCIFLSLSELLWAFPVLNQSFKLSQPDGTEVMVKIRGDGTHHIIESPDGYTLVRDPKTNFLCFAVLSVDKQSLLSSGIQAGDNPEPLNLDKHLRTIPVENPTAIPEMPFTLRPAIKLSTDAGHFTSGTVTGICLLIDFPDVSASVTPQEINAFCNQTDYAGFGNCGSVRDYFYDVSGGCLKYTNVVPEFVYTARHDKAYYDNAYFGVAARELIIEALNDLEARGFDFSIYDSNKDGLIDAINCFYAGSSVPGEGLWPHSDNFGGGEFEADGVRAYGYQICYLGSGPELGMFCHETGHLLFDWPDLYDTDYESMGIGVYCLMSYGCQGKYRHNPVEPCAYLKYLNGWVDVAPLETYQADLSVPDNGLIYKYDNPDNPNEYYLLENRYAVGRDALLPDSGIAIWHIDTNGHNEYQQQSYLYHYQVTLMQADHRWDLEENNNSGDGDDLWSYPDYRVCGPYSNTLSTPWWDGQLSGFGIRQVGSAADSMTFSFELDPARISSQERMHFEGAPDGPFIPAQFTVSVTNGGPKTIETEIEIESPWLTLEDPQGIPVSDYDFSLAPGEQVDFLLYLNGEAECLPEGYYYDVIEVRNHTTGIYQQCLLDLTVRIDTHLLLEDDFENGLPDGWEIDDVGEDGDTWKLGTFSKVNSAVLEGDYAYIDRLYWSPFEPAEEALVTPVLDCSALETVGLEFDQELLMYIETTQAKVQVSVDSGDWVTLTDLVNDSGRKTLTVPQAAGQGHVRFRWYYAAPNQDAWWCIDNVVVRGRCAVQSRVDTNNDCRVDLSDLQEIVILWMDYTCGYPNAWCHGSDINHSGGVNLIDFMDLSAQWQD